MYNHLPASSEASLIPTDGRERRIRIVLDPEPATAEFEVIADNTIQ
jgi:hypothetical protein